MGQILRVRFAWGCRPEWDCTVLYCLQSVTFVAKCRLDDANSFETVDAVFGFVGPVRQHWADAGDTD